MYTVDALPLAPYPACRTIAPRAWLTGLALSLVSIDCHGSSEGNDTPGGGNTNWAEWPMPNSQVDVTAGALNLENYTANGDGTVTDNVTGLVWQQAASSTLFTQAGAIAYCAGLSLGGHTDWRAPSYVELVSLVDYGKPSPSINASAFPGELGEPFWSSTPYAVPTGNGWVVTFNAGYVDIYDVTSSHLVRCVR